MSAIASLIATYKRYALVCKIFTCALAANTVAKCLPRSMILKRSMALWISKVNVTYTDLSQVKMLSLISTSVSQLLNEF